MKCLSLWQPWASMIPLGHKRYETRSWATKYRGPLAIHAALAQMGGDEVELLIKAGFVMAEAVLASSPTHGLPLGCIVCTCVLADCVPVEQVRDRISDVERALGDYTDGRFAFRLDDVKPFKKPIPWKGAQRIFNIPDYVIQRGLAA